MSIAWMESFDFYGANIANALLRGYTRGSNSSAIASGASARTGTSYLNINNSNPNNQWFQKALDSAQTIVGQGVGINFQSVPTLTGGVHIGLRWGSSNRTIIQVVLNPLLGFNVYGGTTLLGSTTNNLIVTGTYYWIEGKVICGTGGTASFELRVNGATVLTITGLTIVSLNVCALGKEIGGEGSAFYDDWVIWDGNGTQNNDFLGDRRIVTLYPNADTALAQWTPTPAGTGFSCIDEANPSDTDFVTANNAGDISEFNKQAIPADVNTVAAVCPVARAFKDSAGPSTFRVGINSAGNVINSGEFLPNTTVAYFSQIFEENPNGNIPWTKAAVDASSIRLTRAV